MPNHKQGKPALVVRHGQEAGELMDVRRGPGREASVSLCCMPVGCDRYFEEPIHLNDPKDAVKLYCNNEQCEESGWMHGDCFQIWEQHVLAYLRSCGRARSWSEKQRLQNLWTKKGYDLAYKACDCKCGKGHLRKDLDYISPPKSDDKKQKKHKKRNPVEKNIAMGGHCPPPVKSMISVVNSVTQSRHDISMRPQLRVRTSSFSSTGSSGSPPSSAGTPPLTPGGQQSKFDFFTTAEQAVSGNIFRRRTDFSVFNVLPRSQQNPYHIKMEDEGPHGNDETRCFVLTNLSSHHVTEVRCVVCNGSLPVFDKYPLIDGSFFLSPQRYNTDLQVLSNHKMMYLNAVCMKCLSGARNLRCRACKTPWNGQYLVIGSMYSYDIFAAVPCCAQRLRCNCCRQVIIDPGCTFQFFSEYTKPMQCPHCRAEDYHFVKPLDATFVMKPLIRC